ncbi:uncharacterized protein LOC132551625 [Ylistrum balloti]|uniref:uncharacterized protein LOC132551625 n=1 Tax=Ylistrum balloti TaxID=509963 RepID=UPI002905E117|nr:uncharacterized protein LOC132551625 [Ylistrum balloti]
MLWISYVVFLFNLTFCSADVIENKRKADELNLIASIAFHEKITREGPALKELVEIQAKECEAILNRTFEACEVCRSRNPNVPQTIKNDLEKLLLLIVPRTFHDVTGTPLETIVGETVPSVVKSDSSNLGTFFKGTLPKVGKDITKHLGIFFTKTLPKLGKVVGNHLETFFTKTIPKTGKKAGGHVDVFFTDTIPTAGKDIGGHVNTFFTKTLPSTGTDVGKNIDTFFRRTIPKTGNEVGKFLKKTFSETAKTIETFFKETLPDLFTGRRRRQTSECHTCDKINTETMTSLDLMRSVCGQAYVNNIAQYKKMVTINKLIHIDKKPIITKVTFMRKDVVDKVLEGVASASPIAVTYTDGTTAETLKSDATLDLLDSNQALGEQLAKEIWDMI